MGVTVRDLGVSLGSKPPKRVLDRVSFEVRDGEFLSLLGASGAGKSTVLKIVAGILVQDEGSVAFDGEPVDEHPAHKRRVGLVFQDMRLFPNMNAEENVAFPCKMQGMGKRERLAWARRMLEQVQLEGFGARDVASLSGGQQQRVALARALAGKPRVLLLDEPFSGLDEHLRDEMRSLVLRLHRLFGMTTIMVTHDAIEAIEMSDRIVYLERGTIVQDGRPEELYAHPASRTVATCFGACSTIEGEVRDGAFRAGPLLVEAGGHAEGAAICVVRQACARVVADEAGPFRVRCCVFRGEGYLARLDVEGQTLAVPVPEPLEPGRRVAVELDASGLFVYPEGAGDDR